MVSDVRGVMAAAVSQGVRWEPLPVVNRATPGPRRPLGGRVPGTSLDGGSGGRERSPFRLGQHGRHDQSRQHMEGRCAEDQSRDRQWDELSAELAGPRTPRAATDKVASQDLNPGRPANCGRGSRYSQISSIVT